MKSFTQFLTEEDFTYTTDQNKTDDHVKSYVKSYIDQPKVSLSKNGVDVGGSLKQSHTSKFTLDDSGEIIVNIDLTKFVEGFVNYMINKMINEDVIDIISAEFDSSINPQGSNIQAVVKYVFKFVAGTYTGQGEVDISGISKDGEINDPQLKFNCNWKQAK